MKPAILLISLTVWISGCAYQLGYSKRILPGGYQQLAIPVFANRTQEVGAEVYFTNAMIRQFERSQAANVVSKKNAPVILEGTIDSITYVRSGDTGRTEKIRLPEAIRLNTAYRVLVTTSFRLRKISDNKILWKGSYKDERLYLAPQLGLDVVNSANPLYDHSARHQNLELIAADLMSEVHDRITENF